MTGMNEHEEHSQGDHLPESGTVIDAAARRRPRVHDVAEKHEEEAVGLNFLTDVPLRLNVILGETDMSLGEVIGLETGSVVQLDKLSGDPIDIYVENQKLGRGEVVVLHEKIRIRLLEITPPTRSLDESKPRKEGEE
jgi:flagellar motor switch protein FliN